MDERQPDAGQHRARRRGIRPHRLVQRLCARAHAGQRGRRHQAIGQPIRGRVEQHDVGRDVAGRQQPGEHAQGDAGQLHGRCQLGRHDRHDHQRQQAQVPLHEHRHRRARRRAGLARQQHRLDGVAAHDGRQEQVEEHAREVEAQQPRVGGLQPDRVEEDPPAPGRGRLPGGVEQHPSRREIEPRPGQLAQDVARIGPVEDQCVQRERAENLQPA